MENPRLPLASAEFSPACDSDELGIIALRLVRQTDGAEALTKHHRGGELDDGQVPVHAAGAEVIVMKSSKEEFSQARYRNGRLLLWSKSLLAITLSDIMISNYNLHRISRIMLALSGNKNNFDFAS